MFSKQRRICQPRGNTRKKYLATVKRTRKLLDLGFRVIQKWECEVKKTWDHIPKKQTRTYPRAILYDFEAYHDKTNKNEVTASLTYKNTHAPISVSIGETMEHFPTHICDANQKELIRRFMEELERRGKNIRAVVRAAFIMPDDNQLMSKRQRRAAVECCDRVPVLEFNCGRHDLNLIISRSCRPTRPGRSKWGKRRTRRCS